MTCKLKLKVGDQVKSTIDVGTEGLKGMIVGIKDSFYEVQFEGWDLGHNGSSEDNNIRDRWYLTDSEVKVVLRKTTTSKQTYRGNGKHNFEMVVENGYGDVMRLRVPGGWLYRDLGSCSTVFVPLVDVMNKVI